MYCICFFNQLSKIILGWKMEAFQGIPDCEDLSEQKSASETCTCGICACDLQIPLEFWMSDEFFIGVHSRAWVCPCRSSQVSITWWKSWKRFPREGDSISSHSQSVWENSSQQSLQLIQGKGFYMYCKAQGLNLLRSLSDRKLNRKKHWSTELFWLSFRLCNYVLWMED